MANGIKNKRDQPATAHCLCFSHHSPAIRGITAMHRSIHTNGIHHVSGSVAPSVSVPDSLSAARALTCDSPRTEMTVPRPRNNLFFIVFASY